MFVADSGKLIIPTVHKLGALLGSWEAHEGKKLAENKKFWREIIDTCRHIRPLFWESDVDETDAISNGEVLLGAIASAASARMKHSTKSKL